MTYYTALLLLLSALACLSVAFSNRIVIEHDPKEGEIPFGWEEIKFTSTDLSQKNLTLTIALKQRNLEQFEELFWKVSSPKNRLYRNFLTHNEIRRMIAPSTEDVKIVVEHLRLNGASDIALRKSGDFVTFKISVQNAEQMLGTTYKSFTHAKSGKNILKAHLSYSLPSEIAEKVDFVSGFRFPNVKPKHKKAGGWSLFERTPKQISNLRALPPGNSPVLLYINPLDSIAMLTVLPRCADGSVSAQIPVCGNAGQPITAINVWANQTDVPAYQWSTYTFTQQNYNCLPCSSATGHVATTCQQAVSEYGLQNDTIFCQLIVQPLHNYVETIFELQSSFGNVSGDIAPQTDLPVWLGKFVTPQELQRFYGVPEGTVASDEVEFAQSVAEFLGQYYSPADLDQFFQVMALPKAEVELIGVNNVSNPGGEASLDIQYIMGVAPGITTYFWSLDQLDNGQEPFLEWIIDVITESTDAFIHSISYGDDENSLTVQYMNRVNVEFMKAGILGLSLFFASGDNGVFGGDSTTCNTFVPSFPPTSPYVTAVGATLFSTQTIPICSENLFGLPVGCSHVGETTSSTSVGSRISSGGGTSNVFTMPQYQLDSDSVTDYFSNLQIPTQYWNQSGRAYPDIATIGHNYLVILGGEITPIDGTSAATPTAAAIFSLLTDKLYPSFGKLGFLNPLLYNLAETNSTAFNDIKTGDNRCSEDPLICCDYGYPAALGYDAVTGLGSPRYDVLLKILQEY
eukprot:TRINITY_DN2473_c0_g1_i2.p1 TRINITY_DN2473_c0_g1~~TRINITY_DN2473_c0_g1_i2.p1  ORF type:complete len:741 (+),score=125.61 TRINITY_DN2473_c0_g1_i2:30-2252(+)